MFVKISVLGCDNTTIFRYEINEQEFDFLNRISKKCNETSACGCQPRMEIEIVDKLEENEESEEI